MKHYFLWMNFYYGNTQIRAIVFVFFNGNEIYAYIENINISSYGSESRINMERTEKQKKIFQIRIQAESKCTENVILSFENLICMQYFWCFKISAFKFWKNRFLTY